jgi:hypothetical protein
MSSLRRVQSSKANGALSKGPVTPAGKQRSSLNALRHGLCAKCIVLDHESRGNFLILLQQHVDLFQPANEVEFGMIEEMCAAYWRQRRAWSIETALLEKQIALQLPPATRSAWPPPSIIWPPRQPCPSAPSPSFEQSRVQTALVPFPNTPRPLTSNLHLPRNPLIQNPLVGQPILLDTVNAAAGFQPAIAPRRPPP